MFDGDNSSLVFGDDTSYKKKETELAKRLVIFSMFLTSYASRYISTS